MNATIKVQGKIASLAHEPTNGFTQIIATELADVVVERGGFKLTINDNAVHIEKLGDLNSKLRVVMFEQ